MSTDKDLLSVQQARDLVDAAHKAQAEIAAVFGAVVGVLGETFSVDDLLSFIRMSRKRPLYFKVFRTPPEWNNVEWLGACFAAADQDVLLVCASRVCVIEDNVFRFQGHPHATRLSGLHRNRRGRGARA